MRIRAVHLPFLIIRRQFPEGDRFLFCAIRPRRYFGSTDFRINEIWIAWMWIARCAATQSNANRSLRTQYEQRVLLQLRDCREQWMLEIVGSSIHSTCTYWRLFGFVYFSFFFAQKRWKQVIVWCALVQPTHVCHIFIDCVFSSRPVPVRNCSRWILYVLNNTLCTVPSRMAWNILCCWLCELDCLLSLAHAQHLSLWLSGNRIFGMRGSKSGRTCGEVMCKVRMMQLFISCIWCTTSKRYKCYWALCEWQLHIISDEYSIRKILKFLKLKKIIDNFTMSDNSTQSSCLHALNLPGILLHESVREMNV